jgi:hypothetical protein
MKSTNEQSGEIYKLIKEIVRKCFSELREEPKVFDVYQSDLVITIDQHGCITNQLNKLMPLSFIDNEIDKLKRIYAKDLFRVEILCKNVAEQKAIFIEFKLNTKEEKKNTSGSFLSPLNDLQK